MEYFKVDDPFFYYPSVDKIEKIEITKETHSSVYLGKTKCCKRSSEHWFLPTYKEAVEFVIERIKTKISDKKEKLSTIKDDIQFLEASLERANIKKQNLP